MTSGPEHYTAAEALLHDSRSITADDLDPAQLLAAVLAEAQVRATLALAAAAALSERSADYGEWQRVAGVAKES